MGRWARAVATVGLVLGLLGAAACRPSEVGAKDDADRRVPLAQKALEKKEAGDIDGAIQLYTMALDQNPTLARLHLDLGFLLHDAKKEYVGAIYHYQRYLELRPDTEKREMIEDRVRLAKQRLAATILKSDRWSEDRAKLEEESVALRQKVKNLSAENEELKRQVHDQVRRVEDLQKKLSVAVVPPPGRGPDGTRGVGSTPVRGSPMAVVTNTVGRVKSYQVAKGDTLQRIAAQVYGDGERWREIYKANVERIKDPNHLVSGQVLTIP
jgi:nucleoid-associated protein YgaU